ncbi:MAG: copper-binding transcription factor [Claussenomyces sp. TS43310]|nr:MAG: copper-binding transcription factor [Claussenomyces sp. TS43310]
MPFTNPRRTTKTTSSAVTPSSTGIAATNMSLRKGATFHSSSSPLSEHHCNIPSLPRRSQTTLEDVIEAHKRRVAVTLGDIDRQLSSVDLGSSPSTKQSYRDDSFPVPQGFLNHTVTASHPRKLNNLMTNNVTGEPVNYNVGGRALRPRRQPHGHCSYRLSDSGSNISSDSSDDEDVSMSTDLTSVTDDHCVKPIVAASAITRSAATHSSTLESLPRLSERASNKIHEHILKPLLSQSSLKDFHPLLEDCPRRIHGKEIVCLRDLEKTLMFMAPVSDSQSLEYVKDVAHWFSCCLKEKSKTINLYLEFCLTSIRCIQATVEFLHEREQTRPADRPYTNGYFIDLVDQIKNYAQQVQASKEKEATGESLDEMDPETTDEIKLYGGLTRNGRPAELVRVKKNGQAISIATGQPVKLETSEGDDVKGGIMMKRSLSEQEADDESVMRSMARRKRSAIAQEPPPKVCREPGCKKVFKRSCDLTKHEKTHSRPWKCSDETCKYHKYGWPTEKELDRHVNDKHSDSPVLYKCHFHPCPYKSKRDSNCKQHMEKAHGWNYIRSKNNGKNRSKAGSSALPTPQTMGHQTPESDYNNEHTPEDDEQEMGYAYPGAVAFNPHVYDEQIDLPDYPAEDFMNDIQMPAFISPIDSNANQSSTDTSPFLVTSNDPFVSDSISANFGQNFTNGTDFSLFGDDDIYNARVEIPPTPDLSLYQQPMDTFISPTNMNTGHVQRISQVGHGNHMLYTPVSAIEDSFEYSPEDQPLGVNDFQLYNNTHNDLLHGNNQSGNLFGEAPSAAGGFTQNSNEYFQAFYNQVNENGTTGHDWIQQDDGFGFINQQ